MKTFTIEEAVRQFHAVAQIAFAGETVLLVGSKGDLVLKPVNAVEDAIPLRPLGFFDDLYSKAEAQESNRLAARGPRKPVL